jgi:hypothetical protein
MNVSTNTCDMAWFIGGLTICVECLILDGAHGMEYTRRLKSSKVSSAFELFGNRGPRLPKVSLPNHANQNRAAFGLAWGWGAFELGLGRNALGRRNCQMHPKGLQGLLVSSDHLLRGVL